MKLSPEGEQSRETMRIKKLEQRIKELERALGKKSLHVEILKDAIKIGREKKLFSPKTLQKWEDIQ